MSVEIENENVEVVQDENDVDIKYREALTNIRTLKKSGQESLNEIEELKIKIQDLEEENKTYKKKFEKEFTASNEKGEDTKPEKSDEEVFADIFKSVIY